MPPMSPWARKTASSKQSRKLWINWTHGLDGLSHEKVPGGFPCLQGKRRSATSGSPLPPNQSGPCAAASWRAIPCPARRCRDPKSRDRSLLKDTLLSKHPKPPILVGKHFVRASWPTAGLRGISEIDADLHRNTQVIPSFPIWSTAPPS